MYSLLNLKIFYQKGVFDWLDNEYLVDSFDYNLIFFLFTMFHTSIADFFKLSLNFSCSGVSLFSRELNNNFANSNVNISRCTYTLWIWFIFCNKICCLDWDLFGILRSFLGLSISLWSTFFKYRQSYRFQVFLSANMFKAINCNMEYVSIFLLMF